MTFFTNLLWIQLAMSLIGSVAFAIVFKIAPRHLIYGGIAGVLCYFAYYTVLFFADGSLFLASLASTATAALFAEVYARIRRAPAIVILSPAIIPIVPGGSLYYTMQHLLSGDVDLSFKYLGDTFAVGLGIACGIVIVSVIFRVVFNIIVAKVKEKKA